MKSHVILGSIIGFLVGAGCSLFDGCANSTALWRACVAALIFAVLARWWSRVWLQSLGEALKKRSQTSPNAPAKTKPMAKT